jgi:branched-chain amino acid transport system substrate-binding protein
MQNIFKKTLLAATAATLLAGTAYAGGHEEKVGVILGFTVPIESLTTNMADSSE